MGVPFRLLREALAQLGLGPEEQRRVLAGSAVTDELALDLDHAVLSLAFESERSGVVLPHRLLSELRELNDLLDAPPADSLWDDDSLETHPTWAQAREQARRLLSQLPPPGDGVAGGNAG
jgi:hypothetical protein